MLKLKNYSFSGIGRFVQKQHIDLETRDNLIQIDGENTNTGGSSGAGKSTTVEALAYLLGISEIPSTQLQSRITKSGVWVQGEFEGDITITRSKKDGLTIETPEGTVSGNSKLAEEKLDEITGLNRKLLKTMCYKRQKQGGFFLNLTPKDSHDFLVECLDLGLLKKKTDDLSEKLKDKYKPRKIQLESEIGILSGNLEQFKTILSEKTEPQAPVLENTDEMNLKISALEQQLHGENVKYKEMLTNIGPKPTEPALPTFEKETQLQAAKSVELELKQKIAENRNNKQAEIDRTTSAINQLESKIKTIESNKSKIYIIKENYLPDLEKEMVHIKEGNCPTCLRSWEVSQEKLAKVEGKIAGYKKELEELSADLNKQPEYETMLEKARDILGNKKAQEINVEEEKQLSSLQEDIRKLQNEKDNIVSVVKQQYLEVFNKWNEQFQFIESEYKKKENDTMTQIRGLKSDIEKVALQKKAYEDSIATYKRDVESITKKLHESQESLIKKSQERDETDKNIILSEEGIRLIKNFTLQKFQDTLDYIGQRATEIINQIPNMANAVIFFENAKENKNGNIKNEVNAVINLEGDSEVPIKTLSGGERTSADFAIDLAVGEMIESMTKKGVNFLIIDEGFDGLDSVSKIQCLEILKTLNTEKKILMVDHSSEVKEMVCDIIKVKRINEESFVQ